MAKQRRAAGKSSSRASAAPRGGKGKKGGISGSTIVLTTLSLGAAGVLCYLGWQYMKSRKAKKSANLDESLLKSSGTYSSNPTGSGNSAMDILSPLPTMPVTDTVIAPPIQLPAGRTTGSSYNSGAAADDFPLKRGSKGENVRAFQQALIKKYGSKILPKYGADGDFGSETAAALKKLKMPAQISETFFNVLTQGSTSSASGGGTDLSSLAAKIYNATVRRDFSTVISLLKNIKSSDDYSTVSEAFKQYRLNGVRKTLVTGLLDSFTTSSQKQQLRLAFATMGLIYDGSKWSLAGIDGIPIVTVVPSKVWVNARSAVTVPARMVLGHEIARRLQYVMFVNNGRHFLVHANCIRHL